MKKLLISLAALAVVACASDQTKKPEADKTSPKEGELSPVGVIPTTLLHDAQRNKDVDVSIEYPTRGSGPFPVIIESNTYGISNRLGEALVANWTGHGYVVIRPAHADAGAIRETMRDVSAPPPPAERQSRSRRGNDQKANPNEKPAAPVFRGAPDEVESEKQTEAQWRDRARDISLVIDSLPGLEERFPELKGKIDRTKIGLSGHAYGAFTALLLAGMHAGNLQMADARVRAVLAMSPEGVGPSRGLTPESFRDIKIPVMFMSGSRDYGATEDESPDWRKTAYLDSPPGDKYWVLIEGARHPTFAGMVAALDTSLGSPGTGPMGIDPRTGQPMYGTQPRSTSTSYLPERSLFDRIRSIGIDFFDAYLKGDAKAKDKLAGDLGSNVTVEKK